MKATSKTATDVIRKRLKSGKWVNQIQALELTGSWRLSGIINRLKAEMDIVSKQTMVTTRFNKKVLVSSYKLKK